MWWVMLALGAEPDTREAAKALPEVAVMLLEADLVVVPGKKKKSPVIVQYSDWRCPHCLVALPRVIELANRTGAELRFRNFPLDGACNPIVPMGEGERCALARASVCAAESGLFLEFAESALDMPPDLLTTWTETRGLGACVAHPNAAARVDTQLRAGIDDDIQGTPTFFVRMKKRWVQAESPEHLENLLD